ncbi:MAG: U32 family peptidase [Thermoplasmata archaeon]
MGRLSLFPYRFGAGLKIPPVPYGGMEIVLASNFDDRLVSEVASLPVTTFFGGYPVQLTGAGRPPRILPSVDPDRFRAHVATVHRSGRSFIATLNSNDLGLQEYRPGYVDRFLEEVAHLLDLGVDGFVVALPALIEAIRSAWPDVPISVSTFARIRTVTQAEYFLRLGARTIILEEANRDFRLIRGLVEAGAEVEILVNQTCLPACPYRGHHLNTSSLASQPGAACPEFEFPILECGVEYVRDPAKIISGIFVRPEDLEVYEEAGVTRFKISGRNQPTDWLVRAAQAYSARSYPGNLADILSLVQVRGTRGALARLARSSQRPEADLFSRAFEPFGNVTIDNRAFPKGFLRHIASVDCEHTTCSACGYCPSVAAKVLRISGQPLAAYHPPEHLPSPIALLSELGSSGDGAARRASPFLDPLPVH